MNIKAVDQIAHRDPAAATVLVDLFNAQQTMYAHQTEAAVAARAVADNSRAALVAQKKADMCAALATQAAQEFAMNYRVLRVRVYKACGWKRVLGLFYSAL